MRMVFGDKAFFGYIKEGDGPVFWFDSFPLDEDDCACQAGSAALGALTRTLHANDPVPVRAHHCGAVNDVPRSYPVFDMQHLPRWHDDCVVLLGDAAHAVSPHAGQGASMAIEDAVVLAACAGPRTPPAPRPSPPMSDCAGSGSSTSSGSAAATARRSGRRAASRYSSAI